MDNYQRSVQTSFVTCGIAGTKSFNQLVCFSSNTGILKEINGQCSNSQSGSLRHVIDITEL